MTWPFIPARRDAPELMDAPGLPTAEVADAYRVLRTVNRQFFGSLRSMAAERRRFVAEDQPSGPVIVLDLGAGSGDVLQATRTALADAGLRPITAALDRDPVALAFAAREGLPAVGANALRLPFADRSVDLVTAVKFAHHFTGPALARLLAEMARVARRRVVVLDIRRSWLAYGGFVAWSRVFTRNRLVRYDGPLSVLRGFTAEELRTTAAPLDDLRWTVRRHFGFQLALVGRRVER